MSHREIVAGKPEISCSPLQTDNLRLGVAHPTWLLCTSTGRCIGLILPSFFIVTLVTVDICPEDFES
jgi:hypothetical protein